MIWYTTQFYTLIFMTQTLKVDGVTANFVVMAALLLASPFFVLSGWVSDRIGRKRVVLAGVLLGALALFPGFKALTHFGNPALEAALARSPVTVIADPADCHFQFNLTGTAKFTSSCDIAKQRLVALSVNFQNEAAPAGGPARIRVGDTTIPSFDPTKLPPAEAGARGEALTRDVTAAIRAAGYPAKADPDLASKGMLVVITFGLVLCLAIANGPVPSLLVELFPTRIRYSSLSLPYHLGTGWFGGMVPAIAVAMVAANGDIYFGLWFPFTVAMVAFVVCLPLLRETKGTDISI